MATQNAQETPEPTFEERLASAAQRTKEQFDKELPEFLGEAADMMSAEWRDVLAKWLWGHIAKRNRAFKTKLLTDDDFREYLPKERVIPRVPYRIPADIAQESVEFKIDTNGQDGGVLRFSVHASKLGHYRTIAEALSHFETRSIPVEVRNTLGEARGCAEKELSDGTHTRRISVALASIREFYETIEDETRTRTLTGPPAPKEDWDADPDQADVEPVQEETIQDPLFTHGTQELTTEDLAILIMAEFERKFFALIPRAQLCVNMNLANHLGADQYWKCAAKYMSEYFRYVGKACQLLPPGVRATGDDRTQDMTVDEILSISLLQFVWLMVEYAEGRLPETFSVRKALAEGSLPETTWVVRNPRYPYAHASDADRSLHPGYYKAGPDEYADNPDADEHGVPISKLPRLADIQGEFVLDIARFTEWAERRSHKNLEQVIDVWQGHVYKPLHEIEDEQYFLHCQPKIIAENLVLILGEYVMMQGVRCCLRVGEPAFGGHGGVEPSELVTQEVRDRVIEDNNKTQAEFIKRTAGAEALFAAKRALHEELSLPYRAYKAQIKRLMVRMWDYIFRPEFDHTCFPDCVPFDFFGQAADTNYWNPDADNAEWFQQRLKDPEVPVEYDAETKKRKQCLHEAVQAKSTMARHGFSAPMPQEFDATCSHDMIVS